LCVIDPICIVVLSLNCMPILYNFIMNEEINVFNCVTAYLIGY